MLDSIDFILILSDERMWLPSEKKLIDQEVFRRDTSTPVLYFAVRYIVLLVN